MAADRFTRLDRMLIAEQQRKEFADLRSDQDLRDTFRQDRALLIERARKLERKGDFNSDRGTVNGAVWRRLVDDGQRRLTVSSDKEKCYSIMPCVPI